MKHFNQARKFMGNQKRKAVVLCGATGALISGSALAEVPSAATDAMTSMQTDAVSLINAGWAPAIAITTAFVLFGLFRKTISRAFK